MKHEPGNRSGSGADSAFEQIRPNDPADQQRRREARSQFVVLVVDDHGATLYATSRVLKGAGYGTLESQSGLEAIDLAWRASAVVLDVNLPDMNGVQVMQTIQRLPSARPVILTSAFFNDALHTSAGIDAGASAYLAAPLDTSVLIAAVDRVLGL